MMRNVTLSISTLSSPPANAALLSNVILQNLVLEQIFPNYSKPTMHTYPQFHPQFDRRCENVELGSSALIEDCEQSGAPRVRGVVVCILLQVLARRKKGKGGGKGWGEKQAISHTTSRPTPTTIVIDFSSAYRVRYLLILVMYDFDLAPLGCAEVSRTPGSCLA